MNWGAAINPNSLLSMALKVIAGGAFAVLGILLALDNNRWEGVALAGISAGWLFFVLRNYRRQRAELESLR